MPFDKEYSLKTQKEVDSFIEILLYKERPIVIDRSLTSPENIRLGREILKKLKLSVDKPN